MLISKEIFQGAGLRGTAINEVFARYLGAALVSFKVLNLLLMLFGLFSRIKSSEVFTLPGLRFGMPGINTEFASFELSDHGSLLCPEMRD